MGSLSVVVTLMSSIRRSCILSTRGAKANTLRMKMRKPAMMSRTQTTTEHTIHWAVWTESMTKWIGATTPQLTNATLKTIWGHLRTRACPETHCFTSPPWMSFPHIHFFSPCLRRDFGAFNQVIGGWLSRVKLCKHFVCHSFGMLCFLYSFCAHIHSHRPTRTHTHREGTFITRTRYELLSLCFPVFTDNFWLF